MSLALDSLVDRSDIAPLPGRPDDAQELGAQLRRAGQQLEHDTQAALRAWAELPSVLQATQLSPVLSRAMEPADRLGAELAAAGLRAALLAEYIAEQLGSLALRRRSLAEDVADFQAGLAQRLRQFTQQEGLSAAVSWASVPFLAAQNRELQGRVAAFNTQLQDAYDEIRRQAAAIAGGGRAGLSGCAGVGVGAAGLGGLGTAWSAGSAGALGDAIEQGADPALLAAFAGVGVPELLSGLHGSRLADAFASNAGLRNWLKTQSVADVTAWWKGMGADDRAALIDAEPLLIGNTNGIPYGDRSVANETALVREMAKLERAGKTGTDEYKGLKAVAKALGHSTPAKSQLKALQKSSGVAGILAALGTAGSTDAAVYQLVSLTLGSAPLAAVSVGNLDTATNATWLVPGMNTPLSSMGDVRAGAANLQQAQGEAGDAVVAWIGYHTPMSVMSEQSSEDAIAGGTALAASVNGFQDYRAALGGASPSTSIVAHSYGTLAAVAAVRSETPGAAAVDHLVLEGSPGIPRSLATNADQLNVPDGEVYATRASHDGLAVAGHISAWLSRTDPTAASFGAHELSSDGTDGELPVDNHGPLDPAGGDRNSYWNQKTQALSNAADATTGKGADLPDVGRPTPTPSPGPSPKARG